MKAVQKAIKAYSRMGGFHQPVLLLFVFLYFLSMLRLNSAFVLCALAGLGSALNVIGPSGDLHVVNAELAPDGTSRS